MLESEELELSREAFREAFIYAVAVDCVDKTLLKLGRATSVRQRMGEFQVCCPFPIRQVYGCNVITVAASVAKEKAMHDAYRKAHFRGEWFNPWGAIATAEQLLTFEAEMRAIAEAGADSIIYSYRWAYADQSGMQPRRRLLKCQTHPSEAKALPKVDPGYPPPPPPPLRTYRIGRVDSTDVPISMRKRRYYSKC